MNRNSITVLAFALMAATGAARADVDVKAGQALHDKNCLKCHNPEAYTRKDHMVKNPDQLNKRVTMCQLSLGLNWFDDDITNVAAYLNQNFYHFKE